MRRQSACARRHSMGMANRRALAGPAGEVPFAEHLLAVTARRGSARAVGRDLAHVSGRSRPGGLARLGGSVRRCEFLSRTKRGACVGKTERGKSTKCMVAADGQGIPLGIRQASASPAEVTLLEPTLDATRVTPHDKRRKAPRPLPSPSTTPRCATRPRVFRRSC